MKSNPSKARIAMLSKSQHSAQQYPGLPFFAHLAMYLEITEKPNSFFPGGIGTVATDGKRFFYSQEFWDELTLDEQIFCWAHEVMHAASGHLYRREHRDPFLWNVAGDLCINPVLRESGLTAPKKAIFKVLNVEGKDDYTEHVYSKLEQKAQQQRPEHGCGGCSWVGPPQKNNKGDNKDGDGDQQNEAGGGIPEQSDSGADEVTESEWRERAIQAAAIAKEAGKLPAGLDQFVRALLPKVNWREKLRKFLGTMVKSEYRFLPPSRKFWHQGLYIPSLNGEKLELAFIADTSGSMCSEKVQGQLLAELRGAKMAKPMIIHLLDADAEVHQERIWGIHERIPDKLTLKGGGGTNIQRAFDYLDKKKYPLNGVLVFTDGYTYPAPITSKLQVPVIWLMTEQSTMQSVANFGEKVYVPAA